MWLVDFIANPGKEHCHALKWIKRYISGTLDLGIRYGRREYVSHTTGFVNAEFAGCLDQGNPSHHMFFKCMEGWLAENQICNVF